MTFMSMSVLAIVLCGFGISAGLYLTKQLCAATDRLVLSSESPLNRSKGSHLDSGYADAGAAGFALGAFVMLCMYPFDMFPRDATLPSLLVMLAISTYSVAMLSAVRVRKELVFS